MIVSAIFSGYGGQGVLLMGNVLSHGAMAKGLDLTFMPAYGSEMRGGTANCTVILSDEGPIVSPLTTSPDMLVAMNPPSVDRFGFMVKAGGLIVLNASLVPEEAAMRGDVNVLQVPIVELAEEVGSARVANMVMIGAVAARTGLMDVKETVYGMTRAMKGKEEFHEINEKGIQRGFDFVEQPTTAKM